jgi:hypothetical protein
MICARLEKIPSSPRRANQIQHSHAPRAEGWVGQLGLFDLNRRYEGLNEKNDSLVAIAAMVPFASFRPNLKAALINGELRRSEAERKSSAGRKPWDEVVILTALVLQALYNLSGDQPEYQLRDRLSLMRFLGLGIEDAVPNAKTLWLYRERWRKRARWKSCSICLMKRTISPWVDRSSTRRSYRLQSNTTRAR